MIVSEPVAAQTPIKKRGTRLNYALAATLIAGGATLEQAAKEIGAQSVGSLRVGLYRRKVTVNAIRNDTGNFERIKTVATRALAQASEELRADFASELAATTAQLRTVKMGKGLKQLRQRAEVLEPLARTAKIVHDWGNEQSLGIVALGIVEHLDQAQDALEVQSSVSIAPTGSVPEQASDSPIPQDQQSPS